MAPKQRRIIIQAEDARDQASEAMGFLASRYVKGKSGKLWEIPHKNLLDAEQEDRWDELQFAIRNEYDREPDIYAPDVAGPDGSVIPGRLIARGATIYPHQKKGKLVKPSYQMRIAAVLWGEDGAKEAAADGVNPSIIQIIWGQQDSEFAEWRDRDPKSGDRDSDVGAGSDRDRSGPEVSGDSDSGLASGSDDEPGTADADEASI